MKITYIIYLYTPKNNSINGTNAIVKKNWIILLNINKGSIATLKVNANIIKSTYDIITNPKAI